MEAIWWKTQGIDPKTKEPIDNPTLHVLLTLDEEHSESNRVSSKDITSDVDKTKEEMIKEIVDTLEEGYKKVEQYLKG